MTIIEQEGLLLANSLWFRMHSKSALGFFFAGCCLLLNICDSRGAHSHPFCRTFKMPPAEIPPALVKKLPAVVENSLAAVGFIVGGESGNGARCPGTA
jgi:hypothetical protein